MRKLKRKHWLIIGGVVLLTGLFAYGQRQQVIKNSTESRLTNPPREQVRYEDTFYYEQLNDNEKEAYEMMVSRLQEKQGGTIVFTEPLSVREYARVTSAVQNEKHNYFYGFCEIPMTENDIYIPYNTEEAEKSTEQIAKAVIFISCAEGINEKGEYDDNNKVMNLSHIEEVLSVNNEEKAAAIIEKEEKTEEIIESIIANIPSDAGQKETIDYFLQWMDENLTYAQDENAQAASMEEVFEKLYIYNNNACVLEGKATALGGVKLLSTLCNRAGMPSHIVMGAWGRSKTEGHALCEVKLDGESIYIDALGYRSNELANQRYLSEDEAKKQMTMVPYFLYE